MAFLGLLLLIIPFWRICQRAGFHPALSLLVAIPYVGILLLMALLALAHWRAAPGEQ